MRANETGNGHQSLTRAIFGGLFMVFFVGSGVVACSPFEVSKTLTRKGRIESITQPQAKSQPGPGQIAFVQMSRMYTGDRNDQSYQFRFQIQDGGSLLAGTTIMSTQIGSEMVSTTDYVTIEDVPGRVSYSVESRCIDSTCGRVVFHVLRRTLGSTQIEKSLAAAYYSVSDGPASRYFEENSVRFGSLDEVIAAARQSESSFMTP